ncbi:MAG TPA: SIMPL domain-containing protein, partial [Ignavibacteriaceae bacterium]
MKSILLLLVFFFLSALSHSQQVKFIEVTGTSNIAFPADQINWQVNIKKIADTFSESRNNAEKVLRKLEEILSANNIDKNNIQVSPIQQGRYYEIEDRNKVFKGYFTNFNVDFVLRELNQYSAIISQLSESGDFENLTTTWNDSKYEEHHKNTLIQASDNAKYKVEYLAENLGMMIGSVLEVQETSISYPTPFNTSTSLEYDNPAASGKISYTR